MQTSDTQRDTAKFLKQAIDAGPKVAFAAVFVALSTRLFLIVDRYSVDIFFGDHWAFEDATLFQKRTWLEIVRWQVGPIRQRLGGLLLRMLEPLIHWNQRYETFGIVGIITCACLAALWLKLRLFGKIGYSDVIIPLLFLTPVQYETLLGAKNPSHGQLPLLLVVLYCLAWTIASDRRKYATLLVLNVLLIYTGFGLFMGFITPLLLATAANALLKLLREGTDSIKPLGASVLLGYSLIFCFAAAYGRTCVGQIAPRYMTYLIPAFFGLYLAHSR